MTPFPSKTTRPRRLKTTRTVFALILREMATTYGRSPGGYVWAIVEPAAALALLTAVFALVLRNPSLGTNFPLFYATGFLPFMLYNDTVNKTARAIRFSRPLLEYPGVRVADMLLARFLLNFLTHLMVFYVIMIGLHVIFDLGTILDVGAVMTAFLLAAILGFGIGVLNCYLMMLIPVWEQAWSILNRPMFILAGILFTFEDVPAAFRDIMWYNPLIHIIGLMRRGFYATYDATYVSVAYVLIWSLVPLFFGLLLLHKNYRELLTR